MNTTSHFVIRHGRVFAVVNSATGVVVETHTIRLDAVRAALALSA